MYKLMLIFLMSSGDVPCARFDVQSVSGPNCGLIGQAGAIGSGLSEEGSVCGWFSNCASYERPFYWPAGGTRTEIIFPFPYGPLGGARAYDIENGIVVGRIDSPSLPGGRAFKAERGAITFLDPPVGDGMSDATNVNAGGVVVGWSTGIGIHAVFWMGGRVTSLQPQLPIGPNSLALDVNDSNSICGWMGVVPATDAPTLPFVWQGGTCTTLPIPALARSGAATALNNRGDACGYYFIFDRKSKTYLRKGCAWIDGELIELGNLPNLPGVYPNDINDAREIVGYCLGDDIRPFIWRDGVMRDLNELTPPGSPFLQIAWGNNNKGQITGEAIVSVNSAAFLLTPALPQTPGDVNCDGTVNVTDLLAVISAWDSIGPVGGHPADLNRDNRIDVYDLIQTIFHWG